MARTWALWLLPAVAAGAGVEGCESSFWQLGALGESCEDACRTRQAVCKDAALDAWAPFTDGDGVETTFKFVDVKCAKVLERDASNAPLLLTATDTCVGRRADSAADCAAGVSKKQRRLCTCCEVEFAYPPTQAPSYAPTPAKPKPTPPPNTPRPTPADTPAPTTDCSQVAWALGAEQVRPHGPTPP